MILYYAIEITQARNYEIIIKIIIKTVTTPEKIPANNVVIAHNTEYYTTIPKEFIYFIWKRAPHSLSLIYRFCYDPLAILTDGYISTVCKSCDVSGNLEC
jgi:hypothetical protein